MSVFSPKKRTFHAKGSGLPFQRLSVIQVVAAVVVISTTCMELAEVDCRIAGAQWIIQNDLGRVFVSCRTLSRAMGIKKATDLAVTIRNNGAELIDKSDFPPRFLSCPAEDMTHLFTPLAGIPLWAKGKHLSVICAILAGVEAALGRRHFECAEKFLFWSKRPGDPWVGLRPR